MAGLSGYMCCKPSLPPRERSIVYWGERVYQAIAVYEHSIVAIPKYVVGGGPLYSRPLRSRLERIVWHYRPEEVATYSTIYEPCLDARVPAVPAGERLLACDPVCRREELTSPRDPLEEDALSLIWELEALGAKAYPTGSILGYYHDPLLSDIDLVIYVAPRGDCRDLLEAVETVLSPLPAPRIEAWARARGVDPSLYRGWARGLYHGREVSIVYSVEGPRRYCEFMVSYVKPPRRVKMRLRVEPGGCAALTWPHLSHAQEGVVLVSFDGVYAPLLYEGGCLEVEGLEARVVLGGSEYRGVVVGVAEANTRVARC